MSKDSRSGGKYGGGHTTLIPAARIICYEANKHSLITKISPGFITSGLRSINGRRRVKITNEGSVILLTVRDNTSQQQVRMYSNKIKESIPALTKIIENTGMIATI
jgi:hypothetical protein